MKKKSIFIVIVNYKTYKDLKECLRLLSNQAEINEFSVQTILVDCAYSQTEVEKLKKLYPNLILILQEESYGLSANLNKGFKKAITLGAEYILMVTPDVYYEKNVLSALIKKIQSDNRLGAVTCKTLLPEKTPLIYFVGGKLDPVAFSTSHIGYLEQDKGQYDMVSKTEFLNCATVLIRANVFKEVGYWEPNYYLTYEDVDWTVRLQRRGYKIEVVKHVFAWHNESSTVGKGSMQQEYYMARNQLLFIQRNVSFGKKILAYLFILKRSIEILPKVVVNGKTVKEYYILLGRVDFLLRRFGYKNIK